MKQPNHNISWLINDNLETSLGGQTEKLRIEIPIPAKIGSGFSEHLHLPNGILLIHTKLFFNRTNKSLPHKIPYGTFESAFPTDVFFSHVIHKGSIEMLSRTSGQLVTRESKTNMFSFANSFNIEQHIYSQENLSYTVIAIPKSTLINLVGHDMFKKLFKVLGLYDLPNRTAIEIAIPMYISNILKNILPLTLHNDLRVLHAKSKVLQYLTDVSLYLNSNIIFLDSDESLEIAEELYIYLTTLEGSTPTLSELAKKFGTNAIRLNNIFSKKYNESIYSFIINFRLSQAHHAITSTRISLKTISFRIGYTNVNNFTAAFKKKYSINPGALRKNSL